MNESQTGLRCPKCGNSTSLNIRNSYVDERREETTITCYSSPCGYKAHIDEFRAESVSGEPPLCADCNHERDDPRFHFEAPGDNWGAALHHFRAKSGEPPRELLPFDKLGVHPFRESVVGHCVDCGKSRNHPFHGGEPPRSEPPRRKLDGKFSVEGSRIINTVSGEAIPEDEPLFLLRARDNRALEALLKYRRECISEGCNDLHLAGISQTIDKFEAFAVEHPERMKQPGITRHFKLEEAGSRPSAPTHTYVGNGEVPCFECSRPLSDEIPPAPSGEPHNPDPNRQLIRCEYCGGTMFLDQFAKPSESAPVDLEQWADEHLAEFNYPMWEGLRGDPVWVYRIVAAFGGLYKGVRGAQMDAGTM